MCELKPDETLHGRYRIEKKINKGGMGIVYKAIDELLSCIVTVKSLQIQTLKDDDISSEFMEDLKVAFFDEARLLANLRHQMLPRVTDYFEENGNLCLVMDYIEGDDLQQQLDKRKRPFDTDDVAKWSDNLLEILEVLHSNDPPIIHRDIKPNNIKVTRQNTVVLLDFGLAKGSAGPMTKLKTTRLKGSSLWSSPEQLNDETTDQKSDLYALAATLWTLLTNKVPPDAYKRERAILKNQKDPLPLASVYNSDVSFSVAEILHKSLAIDREHRHTSASEMRTALKVAFDTPRLLEAEKLRLEEEEKLKKAIEIELREVLWDENNRVRETAQRELADAKKSFEIEMERINSLFKPALEEAKAWRVKTETLQNEIAELNEKHIAEKETVQQIKIALSIEEQTRRNLEQQIHESETLLAQTKEQLKQTEALLNQQLQQVKSVEGQTTIIKLADEVVKEIKNNWKPHNSQSHSIKTCTIEVHAFLSGLADTFFLYEVVDINRIPPWQTTLMCKEIESLLDELFLALFSISNGTSNQKPGNSNFNSQIKRSGWIDTDDPGYGDYFNANVQISFKYLVANIADDEEHIKNSILKLIKQLPSFSNLAKDIDLQEIKSASGGFIKVKCSFS